MKDVTIVDMFCGVGGLTHGFIIEDFNVVAGYDADDSCRYAFEYNNNGAIFRAKKIEDVTAYEINALYPEGHTKLLIGCAPCQPYSMYTQKKPDSKENWKLVPAFADLICEVQPDIVSMENVPTFTTFDGGAVYQDFVTKLEEAGYHVTSYPEVHCPDYGVPQHRTRLVIFASRFGNIDLIQVTHLPEEYRTVEDTFGDLEPLVAGQVSEEDSLHRASVLSDLNLRRIRASVPGGTWRDWDYDLVAECHRKDSGRSYRCIYGRMEWKKPSPTITTQFYGFGNGRFGHPEQDRAISLREGALLQTFPPDYRFTHPEEQQFVKKIGRYIGNAVPVELARVIARSIKEHLEIYEGKNGLSQIQTDN